MTLRISTAPLLGAILLACATTTARADNDDDEPRDRGYCTATAKLIVSACGFEARDDLMLAKAKCINVSDARDRMQCLTDARDAFKESGQSCRTQFEGRRDACRVLGEDRAPASRHGLSGGVFAEQR